MKHYKHKLIKGLYYIPKFQTI